MAVLVVGVCLTGTAAEAPTLTETERLRVIAAAQAVEIGQLRVQAAQRELDTATTAFRTLMQQLQRDGYQLDLPTLTYKPVEKGATTP